MLNYFYLFSTSQYDYFAANLNITMSSLHHENLSDPIIKSIDPNKNSNLH